MKTGTELHLIGLRARFTFFLLTLTLFTMLDSGILAREIKVGVYENRPKVFTQENGNIAGIFPDLIEEMARREGWSLQYVHGSWPECLTRLESGEIDLLMDVAYSSERTKKYDFCKEDVICNWAQVYTQPGMNIKVITELEGMRIAALHKDIHTKEFKELTDKFGIQYELTLCDDYKDIFFLIDEKKVDAGIVNRIFGYSYQNNYAVERSPVIFSTASLRFATKKGSYPEILAAIDQHLADMKEEDPSAYHQSIRRWLGETSKLLLPRWIAWSCGTALGGILLLFLMSSLLKYQVNKKTARLRLTNAQLEEQVAETMKAHLELKESEEKVIRQERLGALGQMTSGIAHDFNNMLTPVLGYSDLLLENPDILENPEELRLMLGTIRTAAREARETVKRIQEFNRADSRSKMETFSLAELVAAVVLATKPLWKAHKEADSTAITVSQEVPKDLQVTAAKSQLSEALMNLVLNSIHALSAGGKITIRAAVQEEQFSLEVQDNGAGMSPEVVQRCVEPFFSTKGEEGTGMGLAMVHGIVKRHNGVLSIKSDPGKGTTITMHLPLNQEDGESMLTPDAAEQAVPPMRILVVDDDSSSRGLISTYLSLDGHEVTTAIDAPDGIEKFNLGRFDLVITDRAMPGVSGDKMAEHVKTSSHPVPVLMITGFLKIMASQKKHPMDVNHIMGKPFTLRELRSAIHQSLHS